MAGVNESGYQGGATNGFIAAVAEESITVHLSESPAGQIRLMESICERNYMRRTQLEKSGLRYACTVKDCVICVGNKQAANRVMTKLLEIVFPWI
jgi:hypothetical protein